MMKTIKCGLIGVGRIGKIHLENLVKRIAGVEVIAVADMMEEGRNFASDLGVKEVYQNAVDVIEHRETEAIIICSPTDTHADYVVKTARTGKAIFCEKPLDLSLDKVLEVLKVVEEAGVALMVAFNRRFDANFLKIKELVKSDKIGDPHILKITSRDPNPPPVSYIKGSGGMFLDMTIHDFDIARFITESEVVEVYAKAAVLVDPEIGKAGDIDTAVITLTFANGAMGIIDNSRSTSYGYDQRLEIFGSEGMAKIDNNRPDNHNYYGSEGVSQSLPLDFFMERYINAYFNEMKVFVEALRMGGTMPVSGKDGLMSLVIGLAAGKSVAEGRPVKVSEIL